MIDGDGARKWTEVTLRFHKAKRGRIAGSAGDPSAKLILLEIALATGPNPTFSLGHLTLNECSVDAGASSQARTSSATARSIGPHGNDPPQCA